VVIKSKFETFKNGIIVIHNLLKSLGFSIKLGFEIVNMFSHFSSVFEGDLSKARILNECNLLDFGISLCNIFNFKNSKNGIIILFRSSFENRLGGFGSLFSLKVHILVSGSGIERFDFVFKGCFGVGMLIDGESDFMDFNFKILNDMFFTLSFDEEMSR